MDTNTITQGLISDDNLIFLKNRKVEVPKINDEYEEYLKSLKEKVTSNSNKTIFSLLLKEETFVFIDASSAEVFFNLKNDNQEAVRLEIKEIKIIYSEYFNNSYSSNIEINFIFLNEACNNHWASFSLNKLFFKGEGLTMVDNSMGHCLDPKFENQEDYDFVKNQILQVKKELGFIE